jgi:uncharacterized membrane protein
MRDQPFFIPALFIGLLAIPLIFCLVPKNRFFGFRTRETMADDKLWYRANRFGGGLALASSAIYLLFAMIFPMTGSHDSRFSLWLAHLFVFAVPLFASIKLTLRYLRKL